MRRFGDCNREPRCLFLAENSSRPVALPLQELRSCPLLRMVGLRFESAPPADLS